MKSLSFILFGLVLSLGAFSATKNDPHVPITHCYHWLNEGSKQYLTFKYDHAKNNSNELTFYTTPGSSNGSVAGPGLYCGKTPADSYSYGDRVIRIDLVDDVVMLEGKTGVKYCGSTGTTSLNSPECAQKTWDIKFYDGGGIGNTAWYVIQNPMAIEKWSASSDVLESDLKQNIAVNDSAFKAQAESTIAKIVSERQTLGKKTFLNLNARASIIDLITKDPSKLDAIPPLNIVSRLLIDDSGKISDAQKNDLYKKFIARSLKSNDTDLADIEKIIATNSSIKAIVHDAVLTAMNEPAKHNALILLAVASKGAASFQSVSDATFQTLIDQIFTNNDLLLDLMDSKIPLSASAKSFGLQKVLSLKLSIADPSNSKAQLLPGLIKVFAAPADQSRIRAEFKAVVFSPTPTVISLKVGADTYYISAQRLSSESQCLIASNLSSDAQDPEISLVFRQQKMSLGKRTSSNIADLCKGFANISTVVQKSPLLGTGAKDITLITGRVETTPFVIVAQYKDDIETQCQVLYRTLPGKDQIDEVFYSVNGSAEQRHYNSRSFWSTESQLCSTIASLAPSTLITKAAAEAKEKALALARANKALGAGGKPGFMIEGDMQAVPYAFFGTTTEAIRTQCVDFYPIIGTKSVDVINWKINGGASTKIYNSRSFWETADAACGQLITAISSTVPSMASINRANLVKSFIALKTTVKGGYEITGNMQSNPFTFYGKTRDEIINQCKQFYDLVKGDIDSIYYSIDGSASQRIYNQKAYWSTRDQVCDQLNAALSAKIASASELVNAQKLSAFIQSNKAAKTSAGGKGYAVSGKIEETEYYIFGLTPAAVELQCKVLHPMLKNPSQIDNVTISVNGAAAQSAYNRSAFWDSAASLCSMIRAYLPST